MPGCAQIVQDVQNVQPLRSVQNVELGDAAGPKLALLCWICRRSDKGRGRGRIKAVVVIRERETCSWPEKYRDRVQENNRDRVCDSELSRFDNSQNVKVIVLASPPFLRLPPAPLQPSKMQ